MRRNLYICLHSHITFYYVYDVPCFRIMTKVAKKNIKKIEEYANFLFSKFFQQSTRKQTINKSWKHREFKIEISIKVYIASSRASSILISLLNKKGEIHTKIPLLKVNENENERVFVQRFYSLGFCEFNLMEMNVNISYFVCIQTEYSNGIDMY